MDPLTFGSDPRREAEKFEQRWICGGGIVCACVDLEWNGGGWFFIKCVVAVPCAGSECVGRIFFSFIRRIEKST